MTPVLRYQDREGRGPFRPGVPVLWADATGHSPPDVFADFPQLASLLPKLHRRRLNICCGCEGIVGINAYFTPPERERLTGLGYRLHRLPASSVVLRSECQVVCATPKPLKSLPRYRHA